MRPTPEAAGRPAVGRWASAGEAEVGAKVALLRGLTAGREWLERRGLAGLLVGREGTLLASEGFEAYVAAG